MAREGFRYPWVDIRHTEHEPYILHPRDQTTGRISAGLFKKAGLTPKVLLFTRNSDIAIRLAASGTALCLAPESYVRKIHFYNPPVLLCGRPRHCDHLVCGIPEGPVYSVLWKIFY